MSKEVAKRGMAYLSHQGYLVRNVTFTDGSKTTSYIHREIMEKHLGRPLLDSEIVHHKDEVKHNNELSNLELTTRAVHNTTHRLGVEYERLICPSCKFEFQKDSRLVRFSQKKGRVMCCSQSCAAFYRSVQRA